MFKRKVFEELTNWKNNYAPQYAALLEGARRVGKSTVAEEFAKANYKSYIKVDFANITKELLDVFNDIADHKVFFLRLQAVTGITLYPRESVIIFDEIQRQPMVRQAIKYLVADGTYDYIETGSLISIKKNVKDIVIPSEEHKISVYPMDYEEFMWATGKRKTKKDVERLADLLDSKTVIACYNTYNPGITLAQSRDDDTFKLYLSDIGLFTTMIFNASPKTDESIYSKLLSDKLSADLGYLYENAVAQMIAATNRPAYYHTWEKENSTHYYEVDFLLQDKAKLLPLEVKSSATKKHESIDAFCVKYSKYVSQEILLSQKDVGQDNNLKLKPIYMLPFIMEEL